MKKAVMSVLAVWLLVCAGFMGLFLFIPDEHFNVFADTIIVDDDGTPGVDCNYTSIQVAIIFANPGDTVFVKNGTYYENVNLYKRVNLIGEDKNNTVINGGGNDDVVLVTANGANITSFTITGSGNTLIDGGVELDNVENCNVSDLNVSDNYRFGIRLYYSHNNIIWGNYVTDHNYNGIYLHYSEDNIVMNNNVSHNFNGIYLESSNKNNISSNYVSISWGGVYLDNSDNNIIDSNNISLNVAHAIYLDSSSGNTITKNTMFEEGIFIKGDSLPSWNTHYIDTSNTVNGKPVYYWTNQTGGIIPLGAGQIILANCTDIKIINQSIIKGSVGILLGFSSNNNITNNNISLTKEYGVFLYSSDDNIIIGNNIRSGSRAISLEESNMNIIQSNNCSDGYHGFELHYSPDNIIDDNIAINNTWGIYLHTSSRNSITNNSAFGNHFGISARYSSDTWIKNNNASLNEYDGIELISASSSSIIKNKVFFNEIRGIRIMDSAFVNVSGNEMIENGINIRGEYLEHWNTHAIFSSNTVDGRPVYYWQNETSGTIPSDAGQVMLANCTNVIIENQTLNYSSSGIQLGFSSNNSIINNNLYFIQEYGIYLSHSEANMIINNNVSYSQYGILLYYSDLNDVMENNASINENGLTLSRSSNNSLTLNYVSQNTDYGINLWESSSNLIYHNLIINNTNQAYDNEDDNQWNNTYLIGGNFWSDYLGVDNLSGPAQDIPGSDGFGDTPFNIDFNSIDKYPLMVPIEDIGPRIQLVFPGNNSVIDSGTILDFNIFDEDLENVNYSIDGEPELTFTSPYDISTIGWGEGLHTVLINTSDFGNHFVLRTFIFTIDSIEPSITLNSPLNNSIIIVGTTLDFTIMDTHLEQVTYTINGGLESPISDPFDLSTLGWSDGVYTIQINAEDEAGNSNSSWFFFTLDSASPIIILNSPGNNSVIQAGTQLDFSVIESNLAQVNYSVNGGLNLTLVDPFDISTSGWADGDYIVQINALDIAGNLTTSWFLFTIDSTKPEILLNSPGNNSYIQSGIILNFTVEDLNLDFTNYSVNGGADIPLSDPFDISTSGWTDGDFTVQINAQDMAGNSNSSWYFFTIDTSNPVIILNDPLNNSIHPSGLILDFSILDPNLSQVDYSINGGPYTTFFDPYDISTFGWMDGDYTILINAIDTAGNLNSSWYFFSVDSTRPTIQLVTPLNNSIISAGTLLDFSVLDSNLDYVNYSINAGPGTPLSDPYDISTSGWTDGDYTVQINTEDMAGNSNSSWYFFTVDSTIPTIQLISPLNNSIITAGTILDFSVLDSNLDHVTYSINGGPDNLLSDPYDISTSGWADGDYTVQINAVDIAGNTNSSWYFFTIDASSPTILLNSPGNNSIIASGTLLDFLVTDTDLSQTNYSINGGADIPFTDPFDISTSGWADGDYTVTINARDVAGNKNTKWFSFTIDSTKPIIQLNSPFNNSIIPSGIILDFSITDLHLDQVIYSLNGGADTPLFAPFDIPTAGWSDGGYTVQINVLDLAGNSNSSSYFFTIDSTPPLIILNAPENNSVVHESTLLDFSIVDSHLSQANYSVNGGAETPFIDPFDISTAGWSDGNFVVQIITMDSAGNFNFSLYLFTIDSTLPLFLLNSPDNNSVIPNGTILDFNIVESNLDRANYSVNGGPSNSFSAPYNISTVGWIDDDYMIQINAVDLAGNSNSSWYFFTLDSSRPNLVLNSPENNSVIPNSTILNFSIIDSHLTQVNYSINGGVDTPLMDPFNIPISGLPDGDYTVQINAVDLAGNSNSSWYFFTIDSVPPIIIFYYPGNNSIINSETVLNFSVTDTHLLQANYSINGGLDIPLSDPFDISTVGWADGGYTIIINTEDMAGNTNSSLYYITLDSTPPAIQLKAPQNNSVIKSGTILDFLILDSNLLQVNYSVNGGIDVPLSDPFNISTAGWTDDNYTIQINASDIVGNSISVSYLFTMDSTPPQIKLNFPNNNTVIKGGVILDFSIVEANLAQANYSINEGVANAFSDPFNIPTSDWVDGDYTVFIIVLDMAGNSNSSLFLFTIDSTPLTISIAPSLNHSIISIGEIIQLDISDPDTDTVMYSINEGDYSTIIPPYNINTSDFSDGRYTINVKANDTAGNEAMIWFEVFVVNKTLISLIDETGDVMNEDEEKVGGHSDIDMVNITIWKVGDYLLYEMSVVGVVQDQIIGSDAYFYSLSLFMDQADDPSNIDNRDFIINCGLGIADIENEATEETLSLEAFGFGTSTLRILIPLSFINDKTDFKISADTIVYINFNLVSRTYDEAYLDTSLDATDLLLDTDSDGIPDAMDNDDDNDGYSDDEDDFPLDPTEWLDTDSDGIGNNADDDDDNDGYLDDEDDFPLDPTEWLDTDSDGIGNNADPDDDGDGYLDAIEISEGTDPLDPDSTPPDNDGDFIPDSIDPDDDNDGVLDIYDDYPFDPTKSKKSKEDGGFGLIILILIIVVVIILVVLLLFLRKRGKVAEEAPIPEEGAIAFGAIGIQEQIPSEGAVAFTGIGEEEKLPMAMPETATYKCPHCEKHFTAPIYQQPMVAVCPSCGKKTTIGPQ